MNIEDLAIKLQETTDRSKRNEGRIKKLEAETEVLHNLATSVAVMAEQLKSINTGVANLTGEVEELKDKPAKRWENLVTQIISIIVAAVVGFVLAKFGF